MMSSNSNNVRPVQTFYKTQNDLIISWSTAIGNLFVIPKSQTESDGFISIDFLCSLIKEKHPHLSYINRNHIIEFFFKDKKRKIFFKNEDYVKYEISSFALMSEIILTEEITSSLYQTQNDLKSALITTVHLLRDNLASLTQDKDGYYHVNDICNVLKKRMPFLHYINKNHIVELFFKDKYRNIIFKNDTFLKYKLKVYKDPPETLYFGTLSNLALKMKEKGIFSGTKRYIKLYTSIDGAKGFASKFIANKDDTVSVLVIESKKAFDKGVRFSTYSEGEFIVSEVQKEYIKEIL